MTQDEKRKAALIWWNRLSLESQLYAVIGWLKDQSRDVTERHPDDLTGEEIQEIWEKETL